MRKHSLLTSLLAIALSAGGVAYAKGPGGVGGGQGYGHMSGQGMRNQNAESLEDIKRTEQNADAPRKQQEQTKQQERQRHQDGRGAQYENRTLTQEQNQVKPTGQSDEPQQLQEQFKEQSQQQRRINQ